MSAVPNTTVIEPTPFRQYQLVTEFERRTTFFGGHPGSFKALAYGTHAYLAPLADVTAFALATGTTPDPTLFRTDRHWKLGGDINVQQEIADHIGAFARLSASNGSYETFDFTEIDRSLSGGLSIDGGLFGRPRDTFAVGAVQNALSLPHQQYLADGGLGILIGDGRLSYRQERILEMYYRLALTKGLSLKGDFQRILDPAYNAARGPVSIYGVQVHYQI
jgi:high affinity Mn2+ porin